jgi:hypothetical protein
MIHPSKADVCATAAALHCHWAECEFTYAQQTHPARFWTSFYEIKVRLIGRELHASDLVGMNRTRCRGEEGACGWQRLSARAAYFRLARLAFFATGGSRYS